METESPLHGSRDLAETSLANLLSVFVETGKYKFGSTTSFASPSFKVIELLRNCGDRRPGISQCATSSMAG
jgi:hypothetical protein